MFMIMHWEKEKVRMFTKITLKLLHLRAISKEGTIFIVVFVLLLQ